MKYKIPNRFHLHTIKIITKNGNDLIEIETDVRILLRIYQNCNKTFGKRFPVDLELFLNTLAKSYHYYNFNINDKIQIRDGEYSNELQ